MTTSAILVSLSSCPKAPKIAAKAPIEMIYYRELYGPRSSLMVGWNLQHCSTVFSHSECSLAISDQVLRHVACTIGAAREMQAPEAAGHINIFTAPKHTSAPTVTCSRMHVCSAACGSTSLRLASSDNAALHALSSQEGYVAISRCKRASTRERAGGLLMLCAQRF